MSNKFSRRIVALFIATCVPVSGMSVANAEPVSADATTWEAGELNAQETSEAAKAAHILRMLDEAESSEERLSVLYSNLGEEGAREAAAAVNLTPEELVSDAMAPSHNGYRGVGEFLSCMKGKVADDIKGIFSINAIAVLLGRENYFEAAKLAVRYLAKQGIKRNLAGLAAALAWYGAKCSIWK